MSSKKVANLKCSRKEVFEKWIEFTRTFHGLRPQLQKVVVLLLVYHYEYSQIIKNEKIVWKQVFDYDTKQKIAAEVGVQMNTFDNLLAELRRKKVIINNTVSPLYNPNIKKDDKSFHIIINFKIDE